MFLLDSSTFYVLVREVVRVGEETVARILDASRITPLTDYEVGNVLWRQGVLSKELRPQELEELVGRTELLLTRMQRVSTLPEDFRGILKLALHEQLPYYDASYVHIAKQLALTLATEDKALTRIAAKYVKTATADAILKAQEPGT